LFGDGERIDVEACLFWGVGFAGKRARSRTTYSDFKIDHLLSESRHLIVKAEGVFAMTLGSEDVITLSLLRSIQNDLAARRSHGVIDIERAARLNLMRVRSNQVNQSIAVPN
jgi:hypothetical protein